MDKHILPAGRYYIGDLCYVMRDEEWTELCSLTIVGDECLDGMFTLSGNRAFVNFGTAYGDGSYLASSADCQFPFIGVDSGTIGCIAVVDIKDFDEAAARRNGVLVQMNESFLCWNDDGVLYFGNIMIDTEGGEEEEENESY